MNINFFIGSVVRHYNKYRNKTGVDTRPCPLIPVLKIENLAMFIRFDFYRFAEAIFYFLLSVFSARFFAGF
jgi:hypothetical protein